MARVVMVYSSGREEFGNWMPRRDAWEMAYRWHVLLDGERIEVQELDLSRKVVARGPWMNPERTYC